MPQEKYVKIIFIFCVGLFLVGALRVVDCEKMTYKQLNQLAIMQRVKHGLAVGEAVVGHDDQAGR